MQSHFSVNSFSLDVNSKKSKVKKRGAKHCESRADSLEPKKTADRGRQTGYRKIRKFENSKIVNQNNKKRENWNGGNYFTI
jgi:hypothetical protein